MNEALGSYRRWRAAEDGERDEDADAAFRAVVQAAMPEQRVSSEFTTRTMSAIAAVAARDRRRARQWRAAVVTGTAVATMAAIYFGTAWAISITSSALVGLLNMLIAAAVRGSIAFQTGASVWSVLATLGRAGAALAGEPNVTVAMIAISAIAIAALSALQRLLGSDGEYFQ
jgi:hypothetical protein